MPTGDSTAVAEPAMIQAGMWLLCDAGWARIERMVLPSGEGVGGSVHRMALVRLLATLRPEADAEVVEIDLIERRLMFEETERVFVCGRCNTFISRDLNLVLKQHNRPRIAGRAHAIGRRSSVSGI